MRAMTKSKKCRSKKNHLFQLDKSLLVGLPDVQADSLIESHGQLELCPKHGLLYVVIDVVVPRVVEPNLPQAGDVASVEEELEQIQLGEVHVVGKVRVAAVNHSNFFLTFQQSFKAGLKKLQDLK
jgi:hypothetical protein